MQSCNKCTHAYVMANMTTWKYSFHPRGMCRASYFASCHDERSVRKVNEIFMIKEYKLLQKLLMQLLPVLLLTENNFMTAEQTSVKIVFLSCEFFKIHSNREGYETTAPIGNVRTSRYGDNNSPSLLAKVTSWGLIRFVSDYSERFGNFPVNSRIDKMKTCACQHFRKFWLKFAFGGNSWLQTKATIYVQNMVSTNGRLGRLRARSWNWPM